MKLQLFFPINVIDCTHFQYYWASIIGGSLITRPVLIRPGITFDIDWNVHQQ